MTLDFGVKLQTQKQNLANTTHDLTSYIAHELTNRALSHIYMGLRKVARVIILLILLGNQYHHIVFFNVVLVDMSPYMICHLSPK